MLYFSINAIDYICNRVLAISKPTMKEPMELPILAIITINKTLRKRFVRKPFTVNISLGILLISSTTGFLIVASTSPVSQPQAINGFKVVNGAATNEVKILKGCPKDKAVNKAAKTPVQRIHADNWCIPVSIFAMKLKIINPIMTTGITQPMIREGALLQHMCGCN